MLKYSVRYSMTLLLVCSTAAIDMSRIMYIIYMTKCVSAKLQVHVIIMCLDEKLFTRHPKVLHKHVCI